MLPSRRRLPPAMVVKVLLHVLLLLDAPLDALFDPLLELAPGRLRGGAAEAACGGAAEASCGGAAFFSPMKTGSSSSESSHVRSTAALIGVAWQSTKAHETRRPSVNMNDE